MITQLRISEASKMLGVSDQRIRSLCREGFVSAKKVKGAWQIDASSLSKYAKGRKKNNPADRTVAQRPSGKSKKSKPIALSFFSGAMGLDLGVERAGFEIRLACEFDKFCRQTITQNRPDTALLGDVNDYSSRDILKAAKLTSKDEIDLIMGGPPCQAFSTAGRRKGFNDERGNVFLKFIELAMQLRPKFLVIENVRGLLSSPMTHRPHNRRGKGFPDLQDDELPGGALNFILSFLRKSGYGVSFNLYNSANFGTPQTRERVVLICSRDGVDPPFLTPTHSEEPSDGLEGWRSLRSCIADINEHTALKFPERRLQYYRLLKPGDNWRSLPADLQREAMGKSFDSGGGRTGFFRRLSWDKPSPTLVTHPAMPATDLAHPTADRPLSIQEYKRIQEFPDDWELAGSLTEQYKQIGNAVPLGLGFAVGKLIRSLINRDAIRDYPGFAYSRYKNTSTEEWERAFLRRKASKSGEARQISLI